MEDYKLNPDKATPYLVITLFDELVAKKGVGLVRGDIIGDLSKEESEILFNMTKDYFIKDELYRKVIIFNRESAKFDHNEHINSSLNYFNKV